MLTCSAAILPGRPGAGGNGPEWRYSRYSKVIDVQGNQPSVREALSINETLDEVLAEQEGDFDADTRWAVAWFEQYGFGEGEFGVAETLLAAKHHISGFPMPVLCFLEEGGCLYRPEELLMMGIR